MSLPHFLIIQQWCSFRKFYLYSDW